MWLLFGVEIAWLGWSASMVVCYYYYDSFQNQNKKLHELSILYCRRKNKQTNNNRCKYYVFVARTAEHTTHAIKPNVIPLLFLFERLGRYNFHSI